MFRPKTGNKSNYCYCLKVGAEQMATDSFGSGGGFFGLWNAPAWQTTESAAYLKGAPSLPPAGSFPTNGRATPDVAVLGAGYQVRLSFSSSKKKDTGISEKNEGSDMG